MSRTYRGRDREKFKKLGHTLGKHVKRERDPVYKNATRTYCVSYGRTKWRFATEGAAKEAIAYNERIAKSRGREAKNERAYYCKNCDGWHLTTETLEDFSIKMGKIIKERGRISPSSSEDKK